jgi:uncharacterized membrane protein YfcA
MLSIIILSCVFIGILVGFLSGLLGIGGGLIIVPVLIYLLPSLNIPMDVVVPMALGTSLCSIVITSSTASLSHYKNSNIPIALTKKFVIPIALGALGGALIADLLSVSVLKNIFSVAVSFLALYMFFSVRITKTYPLPHDAFLFVIAYACGVIASLMGISGAVILIPILNFFGVSLRHSIGLATICGTLVAAFGTIGYIISGFNVIHLPEWSVGYVYLPALISIAITSIIFAPVGVRYASKLPVNTLRRIFAVFLFIVAIKIVFS